MCKIICFCALPKGFVEEPFTPYIARARDGLRGPSDRALAQETKGVSLNSTTESSLASVYKRSFISGM